MLLIRKINNSDMEIIFQWANDPKTRANSLNTTLISWEDHQKWFHSKINSDQAYFYMIENDKNEKVSFIRFEKKENWIVGIVVSPIFQSKGIGKESLRLAVDKFSSDCAQPIFAQIKSDNIGSIKIFEANGFYKIESGNILLYKRD